MIKAQKELEAALCVLGWELDGPKRTSGGWKATIRRGTASVLVTASTQVQVLEELLRSVVRYEGLHRSGQAPTIRAACNDRMVTAPVTHTAEQVLEATRAPGVPAFDTVTGERLILLASLGLDLARAEIRDALLELHLRGELRLVRISRPSVACDDLGARGLRFELVDESALREGAISFHAVVLP